MTRISALASLIPHLRKAAPQAKLRVAAASLGAPAGFEPTRAPEFEDVTIFALRGHGGGVEALLKVFGGEGLSYSVPCL